MQNPNSSEEFIQRCLRSGVVDSARMQSLLGSLTLPSAPEACAELLHQKGVLTSYQKDLLLAGQEKKLVQGAYRILRPLGEGGLGLVFLAEHIPLQRLVAVKQLRGDQDNLFLDRDRLLQEGRAGAVLNHPNLVRIFDLCLHEQHLFLVMEYVEGVDLHQLRLRDGPWHFRSAAALMIQVAAGLEHIHSRGLVHLDVKPSNLMLTPEGVVKILDMGLARPIGESTKGITAGTLGFMAPEQALGQPFDERSDVYGLGATLFSLVSGQSLFKNPTEERFCHLGMVPPPDPVQRLAGVVPPRFAALIARMLAHDPADRFASMAEVIAALEPWLSKPVSVERAGKRQTLGRSSPAGWLLLLPLLLALPLGLLGFFTFGWYWGGGTADQLNGSLNLQPVDAPVAAILFSHHADRIYGGDWSGRIHAWDQTTRKVLYSVPTQPQARILTAALHPTRDRLVVAGMGIPVLVHDGLTGKPLREMPAQGDRTWGLAFCPKGLRLAVCGEEGVALRDWASGELHRDLGKLLDYHWTVAYSPDGKLLAVGGRVASEEESNLLLLDATTGEVRQSLVGHTKDVRHVSFHPTKPMLASASFDGYVRLWHTQTGQCLAEWEAHEKYVERVEFLPSGDQLLTCGGPPEAMAPLSPGIRLWEVGSGKELHAWQTQETVGLICLAVHPQGKSFLTAGRRDELRLWKLSPLPAK
jgi:WD40 repeat protein